MALFHFLKKKKKKLCDSAFILVKHNSALCCLGQYETREKLNQTCEKNIGGSKNHFCQEATKQKPQQQSGFICPCQADCRGV